MTFDSFRVRRVLAAVAVAGVVAVAPRAAAAGLVSVHPTAGDVASRATVAPRAGDVPVDARAGTVTVAARSTLSPSLGRWIAAHPDSAVTAWVEFLDKGERSPEDLARRLRHAEAELSPRNRARRLRAGVWPQVDVHDLPVEPGYLGALRATGVEPFAVSRWLNRAAVRVTGQRLLAVAALPCVARVTSVAQAHVSAAPGVPAVPAAPRDRTRAVPRDPGHGAGSAAAGDPPRAAAIDYGRSLAELTQIGIPALHDSGYTGEGVLVCVLDNGFEYLDRHQATRVMRVPPGHARDFVDGDTVVTDQAAGVHGLWTSSGIGAYRPGEMVGAAFGATFALARTEVEAFERPVEMLYWGLGAEWADSLGADLISSSLGYNRFEPGFDDESYTYEDMDGRTTDVSRAAQIACAKGMLVVNSVGNEGFSGWRYLIAPADVNGDSLIAVGSVAANGQLALFSSIGPSADGRIKPDLVALGINNPSADEADSTLYREDLFGTSMSAPLISGLAACLMQARPGWSPQTLIRALRETASFAGAPNNAYGYGLPNGGAALRWDPVGYRPRGVIGIQASGPNPIRRGGSPMSVRVALGPDAGAEGAARVDVFDARGRRVRALWSGRLVAGETRLLAWAADDATGARVRPGVYWITASRGRDAAAVRVVAL